MAETAKDLINIVMFNIVRKLYNVIHKIYISATDGRKISHWYLACS